MNDAPTADAVEALATLIHEETCFRHVASVVMHSSELRGYEPCTKLAATIRDAGWSLRSPEDAALVEIGRAVQRLQRYRASWMLDWHPNAWLVIIRGPDGDEKYVAATLPEAVDRALASERATGEAETDGVSSSP